MGTRVTIAEAAPYGTTVETGIKFDGGFSIPCTDYLTDAELQVLEDEAALLANDGVAWCRGRSSFSFVVVIGALRMIRTVMPPYAIQERRPLVVGLVPRSISTRTTRMPLSHIPTNSGGYWHTPVPRSVLCNLNLDVR